MKRLTAFFVLFLTALCFALTASAADSAIHSVTIDGNAVKVSLTARTDCALFVGLYHKDGRLLSVQTRDVAAGEGQNISVTVAGGIPAGSAAKAFLTGADNKPLCKSASTSGGASATDKDVYAILYADGTMVFQRGNTSEAGREVAETYAVDMTESYQYDEEIHTSTAPWGGKAWDIQQVEFADEIQPKSTAYWFYYCTELKQIRNIENLDTANVTDMSYMFYRCWSLSALDVSHFDTSNVTNMESMFSVCSGLTALDVGHFDTRNVTNMSGMFDRCGSLETLDVSQFDTSNVNEMSYMFSQCWMKTLNLSNFNTDNVTDMSGMFYRCGAFTRLNLSNFNTANVTDMNCMFAFCGALTTLDLSSFDTANLTDMGWMFYGCSALTAVYASEKFVTNQIKVSDDYNNYGNEVFTDCSSLIGGNGAKYDKEHTNYTYARIDGGASNPGYFTAKT